MNKGQKHTPEAIEKMKQAKAGDRHPMLGRKHSALSRAIMSKKKTGEKHPMFGRKHSAESKMKISNSQKKRWAKAKGEATGSTSG